MAQQCVKKIIVFLDSGLQKTFVPLRKPVNFMDLPKNVKAPASLNEALAEIALYDDLIPAETRRLLDEMFNGGSKRDWDSFAPYLKARFGQKTWHLKNGLEISLNGIWFMIETNTSGQNGNKLPRRFDRGYFYQSNCFSESEKQMFIEARKRNLPVSGGISHYIPLQENETLPLDIFYHDRQSNSDVKIDFGDLKFELAIRTPGGKIRDVDVILDLGNTRTAGLLFDHAGNATFEPDSFKQLFKILRIKPDPSSGEYDSLDDVEAGIVPSWFILHQLEHQKYFGRNDSKLPVLLETEYQNVQVSEIVSGLIFKTRTYEISGRVCQRIPQMFTQLSPVLLGDQAEREFNRPYARAMISVGANLQLSSPKRYYWDDTRGNVWWNLLLNEWDKAYNESPRDATALPTLQGEMLRFIPEDGSILDLNQEREPADAPQAYPERPSYPRQSTLTWFLLHILERAYSQINSAFAQGATFIPHRLRKVLITYPSGWTNDEVNRYRERCQEALDIFSQTNVYHGVKSSFRLEMVPREQTPDEAVAGQLPFVFSEIIRYPGQTAAKWISLVGRKRQGTNTVRIMNFDIGGGTSDISVVEYKDLNNAGAGVAQNLLSTCLLFKDSQAIAGDDLVKQIIEKIILGGLLRAKNAVPGLTDNILSRFTQSFNNREDEAVRSRIVRTCLIPLATMCLSRLGEGSVQFSAQQAGVNQNNWKEFLDFIRTPENAIPFTQSCFSFHSTEINKLMEKLFAGLFLNCAMYAAAYDVDLLIFSGKPSELPYIRTMARQYIPIDDERIIFARDYKAGHWYPFTDEKGYIRDAKTVTVVGGALYYALSNGLISNWKIETSRNVSERNEWGQLEAMKSADRAVFLSKEDDEAEIRILPNTIIARRQNICSSPEPVYKFLQKDAAAPHNIRKIHLKRTITDDGESLSITAVDDSPEMAADFELKLWPCESSSGFVFWQEKGIFDNLE